MFNWIDYKYVNLISNRLDKFRQKSNDRYNCRCPICLDSQKNKNKARGWIYSKSGKALYYCHNCGISLSFSNFLKTIDASLYSDYVKEKYVDNPDSIIEKPVKNVNVSSVTSFGNPLRALKKVSSLPIDHPFKKYVMNRKIPSHHHYRIFYCEAFKTWVNSFIPNKFENTEKDTPRLIFPFLDKEKKFFGCQGRSLSKSGVRYITIMLDDQRTKLFGLDTCDLKRDFYIFEGPIDSMFFDNSIAMCGSDLSSASTLNADIKLATVVFDNEPRSLQIVKRMDKYISLGYRVCFWPEKITQKDVNEMVLAGYEPEELKIIVDKNSYSGIEAKLNLEKWRKC